MQAMLGFTSEARWLRHVRTYLGHLFPFVQLQQGYNKRLRAALPQIKHVIRALALDTDFWSDTVWITDSTSVECGRSRPTTQRSDLATGPPSDGPVVQTHGGRPRPTSMRDVRWSSSRTRGAGSNGCTISRNPAGTIQSHRP